jgi:hypothetical protein
VPPVPSDAARVTIQAIVDFIADAESEGYVISGIDGV